MSHRRRLFYQNNISSAGWKRPFQRISDPEPGHLLAFDQSRELVDSFDDDDDMGWVWWCGMMVTLRRRWIVNTWMELAEAEGDRLSYSLFSHPMKLTEAQMKMASGAFFMESDDESERESEQKRTRRRAPPSSRQTKASRVSQQHQR
jgi:hypothetical protein